MWLACAGAATTAAAPASAQTSYSQYAETPAAALARYVRTLASDPKDFSSLIGAGRAALALGDTQAAAGFFPLGRIGVGCRCRRCIAASSIGCGVKPPANRFVGISPLGTSSLNTDHYSIDTVVLTTLHPG